MTLVDEYSGSPTNPGDLWDALTLWRQGNLPSAASIKGRAHQEHLIALSLSPDKWRALRSLKAAAAKAQRCLQRECRLWQDVATRGAAACRDLKRNVYAGTNDPLAVGTTLAITYSRIGWYRGQVETYEQEIRRLSVPEQQQLDL